MRHVVDVFGADPQVVDMTITNEVNVTFSPNTSDGSYASARQALIQGIVKLLRGRIAARLRSHVYHRWATA